MINHLKEWEEATEELIHEFINVCFQQGDEYFWVSNEIGGLLNVGDYWFDLNDIVEFFRYDATLGQMTEYYDFALEHHQSSNGDKPPPVNFRDFVKYGLKL